MSNRIVGEAGTPESGACPDCTELEGRREFVQRLSLTAAGVLLGLGMPKRVLATMRPVFATGDRHLESVTYPIPASDSVTIDEKNEVILARHAGVIYAFNLSCPHQRAPLRWREEDQRYECPKHHSKYTPDGTYTSGRATRSMDRLAIKRDGTKVIVNLDVMFKDDKDKNAWKSAEVVL